MKMPKSLIIDPRFKNLIPPLQWTEYLQLEENLLADGCRDPIGGGRGARCLARDAGRRPQSL